MHFRRIDMDSPDDIRKIVTYLKTRHGLGYDSDTECTFVMEEDDEILASASYAGNVIKQVALSERWRGTGKAHLIISPVIEEMIALGRSHLFVYTQPKSVDMFRGIGFSTVASVPGMVTLLEWGNWSIRREKQRLDAFRVASATTAGAIVMNANPFTLGHQYLIEQAARQVEVLYVFVVEADRSVFPFETRFELIRRGTEKFGNVRLIPGGSYIISGATFPSYFTQEKDQVRIQSTLDAVVFGKHLAESLSVAHRFVGTEPICEVTQCYNRVLESVLPDYGIIVHTLDRLESGLGVISATKVRKGLIEGDWESVDRLVPETTSQFLKSTECAWILDELKQRNSRH